jgi:hypothetical protein
MKRRLGSRLWSAVPWLVASAVGGCYSHHTADEELLDIAFPDDVYPDAGAPVVPDAGTACTQTDPLQLLLCQFTQGGGQGSIPGLGGGGTQPPDLSSLQDLIGLLGGGAGGTADLGDLLDLLAGLQGASGQGSLPGAGQTPSLQDILGQFVRRDAGTPPALPTVTALQCAIAIDVPTRILCALRGFPTPGTGFAPTVQ